MLVTVQKEPEKEVLRALLEHARESCDEFLLVERPELGLGPSGRSLLGTLQPFLLLDESASQWPGTVLHGGTARVRRYRLTPESIEILFGATDRLFGWTQPDRPEDLCLLSGGVPWLTTIAHEGDAYFSLDESALSRLREAVPALALTEDPP